MPGIRARRRPRRGSSYPSQVVGWRARNARKLADLSQETIAKRMAAFGHGTWTRQTVAQIEIAKRNVTVDELVSLAACLQTRVTYLLSTRSLIDIGGPHPLDPRDVEDIYGFATTGSPFKVTS